MFISDYNQNNLIPGDRVVGSEIERVAKGIAKIGADTTESELTSVKKSITSTKVDLPVETKRGF